MLPFSTEPAKPVEDRSTALLVKTNYDWLQLIVAGRVFICVLQPFFAAWSF
jgi:hypothetical protein